MTHIKPTLLLAGVLLLPAILLAQTDTLSTKLLKELTIQDKGNHPFTFYQSSKLATTEEILGRMEGVNLIRRGPYGMEPTLRHYNAGQINLSIDGMRLYGACTDKMDPTSVYVEPINLEGISAAHGAHGNFQGSSIGGNINLKLKGPNTLCHKELSAQWMQSFSSNNQAYHNSFVVEKSGIKSAFRISGTYRKAQNYHSPLKEIPFSSFEKYNLAIAYQQVVDSSNQLRFTYLGDWGRNMGYPALPMDVGKANAHIGSLTHLLRVKNSLLQSSESKLYYNQVYHEMDDTQRPNIPMHMDMPGWSETFGYYNELNFQTNKHLLKVRTDAHQNKLKADMVMYPKNGDPAMYMQTIPESLLSNMGLALFYQYSMRASYNLKWNGRIDYFKQYALTGFGADQWNGMGYDVTQEKKNWVKSMAFTHSKQLSKSWCISLVTGYAERLPTANERYGFYLYNPMDNHDYLGNMQLKTERSYQVELLVQHEYKQVQWSLQTFYHQTQNLIYAYQLAGYSAMTIGATGVKGYRNIQEANSFGAEASLSYKINSFLMYKGNAKYVQAQNNFGMPLAWVQPLKIQSALRFKSKLYIAQFEHNYSAAQNRINTDFGERKTPAFHLWHVRVSSHYVRGKHTLTYGLAIENLSNKNYFEHLDVGYLPRMGRNFMLNLGYIFR